MQHTNARTIIRSVIAVILVVLGIGALSGGRVIVGVLLLALAACNVTLTVMMRRRASRAPPALPQLRDARHELPV